MLDLLGNLFVVAVFEDLAPFYNKSDNCLYGKISMEGIRTGSGFLCLLLLLRRWLGRGGTAFRGEKAADIGHDGGPAK